MSRVRLELMHACTIAAQNYLAQVRVLAESFLQHHPGATFTVLVVDAESPGEVDCPEGCRVCTILDIGLDAATVHEMATIYDLTEFATAVKPTLLRYLISELIEPVTYLDPDILLYAPIADAEVLVGEHGILLTPHVLAALPRDGSELTEQGLLKAGIYNLGFITVTPNANSFLEWWEERTRFEACIDPASAMFTDQRWIDFVPALFDAAICRDPGWNVAYWNLHERPLSLAADGTILTGGALAAVPPFQRIRAATAAPALQAPGTSTARAVEHLAASRSAHGRLPEPTAGCGLGDVLGDSLPLRVDRRWPVTIGCAAPRSPSPASPHSRGRAAAGSIRPRWRRGIPRVAQ